MIDTVFNTTIIIIISSSIKPKRQKNKTRFLQFHNYFFLVVGIRPTGAGITGRRVVWITAAHAVIHTPVGWGQIGTDFWCIPVIVASITFAIDGSQSGLDFVFNRQQFLHVLKKCQKLEFYGDFLTYKNFELICNLN